MVDKKNKLKKRIESEIKKIKKSLKNNEKTFLRIVCDRKLLSETYDDNYDRISKSDKQSHEHMKLLVIENALNEQSTKILKFNINAEKRIVSFKDKILKLEKMLEKL